MGAEEKRVRVKLGHLCILKGERVSERVAYHDCDGLSVAHKIHVGLPAVSLHDLSGGTRVVHGVS